MIQKFNLRNQVSEYLLDQISRDELEPDEVISLAALSRKLEISVTPIREALNQLSRSGFIVAVPNRGFLLKALNLKEALEIYPIISTLEAMAISHSAYREKDIEKLRIKNEAFRNASSIKQAVMADRQWHDQLVQSYQNESLHRLIADLKIRVLTYEYRFQDSQARLQKSAEEHETLIQALADKETSRARELLEMHWYRSMEFIETKMKR